MKPRSLLGGRRASVRKAFAMIVVGFILLGHTSQGPMFLTSAFGQLPATEAVIDPAGILWTQMNGPPGGVFFELTQNPLNHNELCAVTVGRVYRSQDRGETWQLVTMPESIPVSSATVFGERLFVGGEGVYCLDNRGNLTKVLDGWYDKLTVSDGKLFVTRSAREVGDLSILFADLASQSFEWRSVRLPETLVSDLAPPPSGVGFDYTIRPANVLALGTRMLLNVVLEVYGSGMYTNGRLYRSEDAGESWARVDLDIPDRAVISNIVQDQLDADHILLLFKHTMMHEFKSPLADLVKESVDAGRTWRPFTNLTMSVNAVTDIDHIGSAWYLVCPFDGQILALDDTGYRSLGMPRVDGFDDIVFTLDTLLFDPDDPRVVYGKTGSAWSYGLLKSEDGMVTWRKIDEGIVASSPSIVLCHPSDPDIIMTSGNVIQEKYLTLDGGRTWQPFSPTIAGDELRIDPFNPNHLILIDEKSEIYESYDSGVTFSQINRDFWSAKILDIEVASGTPGRIYASNLGVGVSEYVVGENEWRHLTGSPDYAYRLALDPTDSSVLYAAYSPKLFENYSSLWRYSGNQDETFGWTEVLHVNNSRGISALVFDPSNPNRILVGVIGKEGTVYVSDDRGKTWRKLNEQLTFTTIWGHSQLQIDPSDKNIVYAGTWGGGTYKTINGGMDWLMLDQDHTFSPTWIALSPSNSNIVYAGDRTAARIHRSNDSGRTWYTYYDFGRSYMLTSVVVIDPDDPETVYAGAFKPPMAHTGVLLKIRGGQVIANLSSGLPRSVIEMEIDPRNHNVLYVATHMYGVFKSTNGGATWQRLDDRGTGLPRTGIYDIDVDPMNSSILYATAIGGALPDYMLPSGVLNLEGKCGVYKSTDGGEHWWQVLETFGEARGIDIDPNDHDNLYVADMMGGVWVSRDGGLTWRQENNGLGSTSMTSVKTRDNYIYASTQGSGVYSGVIDNNGTITWDPVRSNKPKAEVFKIQIECDPQNPSRMYASAYPGGLLRSDDGGQNWYDKNFLTPSIKVTDPNVQGYYSLAVNPLNPNIVWMGVYGKGMFVSYDGMDFDTFANGVDNKMMGKRITKVVINPADPNEVYVASEDGIFVTRDNGTHWVQMNDGLQTLDVRTLKIHVSVWPPFVDDFDNGTADQWILGAGWAVAEDDGGYALRGIGHAWASVISPEWSDYTFEANLKLIKGGIHVVFRTCSEGRYFLGLREGGLYLHKQFGNWSQFAELANAGTQLGSGRWQHLRIEVQAGVIKVYINGSLKVQYSDPDPLLRGGVAFETLDDSEVLVDNVSVVAHRPDVQIYAGTGGYGVYRLDLSSERWENLGRTFGFGWWTAWERRMYQFSSILFDPVVQGKVYLGHFPSGFFVSEDSGHTWKDSSLGLGNDGIFSLTMHPNNTNIIWAGTYNGVAKSVDGGRTWKLKNNGMPPQQWPFCVVIDDHDTNVMYASTKNGQNKGLSFRNTFYGVVMKSVDGGENWFRIMEGLDNKSEFYEILIHPEHHNILFLSSSNGVHVSNDAGRSWQRLERGLPTTQNQARDNVAQNLALTADGRYLFLGLSQYGLWRADMSAALVPVKMPSASFSYSPTSPTVKDTIVFRDLSEDRDGSIVSWNWSFGDGTTSTQRNPEHEYAERGEYNVTLVVTDDLGNTDIRVVLLTLHNLAPEARFTVHPSEATEGEEVMFGDASEDLDGNLTAWNWDFGDGHVSTLRNPTHKYDGAGEFTVALAVTDNEGATGRTSMELMVMGRLSVLEWPLAIGIFAGIAVVVAVGVWVVLEKEKRAVRKKPS
jgi:PKD repeat protein